MARHLEKYEAIFSAAAFAEMNEHETALELSGLGYGMRKKVADLKQYLQRVFAAARETRSFSRFLEEVGLQGARFQYVVARI